MAQHVHKQINGFNQAKCGFFQSLLQLCQKMFVFGVEENAQRKAQADTPKSSVRFSGRNSRFAQQGFGLLLLLTFLASSVLVASSLSLLLAPSVAQYMGSPMISESSAQQIANYALDQAQSDILTQLGNGVTVSTSYRYPASGTNSVSIPTYPNSGANASVGTYYVTVTKARGLTYVLQANVSAGTSNISISRLVQLKASTSIFNSALAIYSLRKTRTAYSGYAARVRCASTSTTQDIGFNANGDFDVASLRTCLGDSSLPLDAVTGAKAAYGLRKLRSAYAGYAINVRRSSDSTTQNIGFDANGNLDTVALKSFVGTGNGFVVTWYDQSGNGLNETQATTTKQPKIMNAGVIYTQNNAPAIYFGGAQNLANGSFSGVITGQELRCFTVAETESGGAIWGQFIALYKSGDADAYTTPSGMEVLSLGSALSRLATNTNNNGSWMTHTVGTLFQATTYHDASGNIKLYYDGTLGFTQAGANNLAPTNLILGTGAGGDATSYVTGYMAEVILYNSSLSAANQTTLQKNQGHYYNIAGMQDGFVTTWYDQSGNGRSATQATTSQQPTIAQMGVVSASGKIMPAVLFDGTDDALSTAASTSWPSGAAARTMNIVAQTTGNDYYISCEWGSMTSGKASGLEVGSVVGFHGYYADSDTSTTNDKLAHTETMTYNGSIVSFFMDTISLYTSSSVTYNTTSNTSLIIGNSIDGLYMVGSEAEVVIFSSALSNSDRSNLESNQTQYYLQ